MSVIDSIAHSPAEESTSNSSPFEGPEKLLEIWFGANPEDLPHLPHANGKKGLRTVDRAVWEDMLEIVKCKVLSFVEGAEVDAYLLSESSMFVYSHKLILKTCGTTLNLLGLPRILDIPSSQCGLDAVYRFFYSRKSFMFPERQLGPHKDWSAEIEFLDGIFGPQRGAAYTVGKVNGDHWLLYLTNPVGDRDDASDRASDKADSNGDTASARAPTSLDEDYTLEILMSKLSPNARSAFFFPTAGPGPAPGPQAYAQTISHNLGIDALFPKSMTTLDAYAFTPCGYSANALLRPNAAHEGYYTIHVTPEEGWSYASFECNIPLLHSRTSGANSAKVLPDLETLIQRVVQIFQPGHLSLTLFVPSSTPDEHNDIHHANGIAANGHTNGHANGHTKHVPTASIEAPVDSAHRAFREALVPKGYKRTDKINYEFGGYDLAFASFEAR